MSNIIPMLYINKPMLFYNIFQFFVKNIFILDDTLVNVMCYILKSCILTLCDVLYSEEYKREFTLP